VELLNLPRSTLLLIGASGLLLTADCTWRIWPPAPPRGASSPPRPPGSWVCTTHVAAPPCVLSTLRLL
jgi:hypothetical protein